LLIDERRGRAIASALGLRLRGILGIVAEAHRRGIVDFDETMSQLRQHGFRIADALLVQARAQLGLQA
jgi:predicted nucleic acid-binding protein